MKREKTKIFCKLLLLVAVGFVFQSFIIISNQKVTLKLDNVSLEQVLWNLKEKTGIEFVYSNQDVASFKKVSVDANGKALDVVLNDVLSTTNLSYSVSNDVIVIHKRDEGVMKSSGGQSQQKEKVVKGTVRDKSQNPLAGVSVVVKGTTKGTSTEADGKYAISVDSKASDVTLQFSFIGMQSMEVKVAGRDEVNVEMEDEASTIEEVMVVAYGTVKKESFTGSAQSVKGEEAIKETGPLSVEKALQGYVAGVRVTQTDGQPGANATVQIRGIGSINGNIQPLYIIDGVPVVATGQSLIMYSSVMTSLNPADIESMTVLKDAAATSLYGSRAANGVVIINTKKGKSGKTVFNADYERGWTTTVMPHELFGLFMSGKEYTEYALEGLKNRYLYDNKALPGMTNYNANDQAVKDAAMNYAYLNLNKRAKVLHPDDPLDGTFNYNTADREKYLTNARNTDWASTLFKMGKEDKANISARGGTETLKYFTSISYFNQVGLLPSSNFSRFTGKLNVENKVNKYVTFQIDETLGVTDQSGTESGGYYSNPIWGVRNLNPTAPVYNADGSYFRYPGFITKIANYVKNIKEQVNMSSNLRSLTNASISVNFTDWLTFRSVNGFDFVNLTERSIAGIDSHDGRNERGVALEAFSKIIDFTTSNTLNFNKTFASKHNVVALLGYEAEKFQNRYFYGEGVGFVSDSFLYLSNAAKAREIGGKVTDYRLVSLFGKADYNYAGKYYLSASLRRDGSSKLAQGARWGNFYSFSGAWNISRESFMKDVTWIDNLRLKASYGTTGNLPNGFYDSQALFSLANNYNGTPVLYIQSIGNPLLTWEHSYTSNVGIDFSLFNSRLSGTIEYYNKLTDNLLNNATISGNTGFASILVNEGKLRNQGAELTLISRNIDRKDFKWSTEFNISWMKAMVEELKNDVISNPRIFRQGEHLYSFYAREWAGVDSETGRPLWYKNVYEADGKTPIKDGSTTSNVSEANRVILGKAYPDYFGGLTNRFSYKGLELSFLATFTLGGKMYHYLERLGLDGRYLGTYNPTKQAANSVWKAPGDVTKNAINIFDNPYQPQEISSRHLISTDHVRIKNITLSYAIPRAWTSKLGLSNVRVYLNATDPFTFYKYDYINPEVTYHGQSNAGLTYPALKSYRIGLNIQF